MKCKGVMSILLGSLLQMWICFTVLRAEFYNTHFDGISSYNNLLPAAGIVWSVVADSLLDCGLACFGDSAHCPAFFYDARNCHGYSNNMNVAVSTVTAQNMTYYERKDMQNFHDDFRYQDILPIHGIVESVVTDNLALCILTCLRVVGCVAFFYGWHNCFAYPQRMHDSVSTASATSIAYYEFKGTYGNLAKWKPASMSGDFTNEEATYPGFFTANKSVDGRRNPNPISAPGSCSISDWKPGVWYQVDLLDTYYVTTIALLARKDAYVTQIGGADIRVSLEEKGAYVLCGDTGAGWLGEFRSFNCPRPTAGRFVLIQKRGTHGDTLTMCEVEVYADGKP